MRFSDGSFEDLPVPADSNFLAQRSAVEIPEGLASASAAIQHDFATWRSLPTGAVPPRLFEYRA